MSHHLDEIKTIQEYLEADDASSILWEYELLEWNTMVPEERTKELHDLCQRPLHNFSVIYRWYFRQKWLGIFSHFINAQTTNKVVEIGSGESDIIPCALAKYTETGTYLSVNMNDDLSDGLLRKTSHLPLTVELVRDDAMNIGNHILPKSVDMVVFEHSVNDILQAMLASQKGMDTVSGDWFEMLPQMIRWINKAYEQGDLQDGLKDSFLSLLRNCFSVLKPGGLLVISHYMFQYDLDIGYNPTLWENMLPIVRPWIHEIAVGKEVFVDGYDSQWWMFYKRYE